MSRVLCFLCASSCATVKKNRGWVNNKERCKPQILRTQVKHLPQLVPMSKLRGSALITAGILRNGRQPICCLPHYFSVCSSDLHSRQLQSPVHIQVRISKMTGRKFCHVRKALHHSNGTSNIYTQDLIWNYPLKYLLGINGLKSIHSVVLTIYFYRNKENSFVSILT